MGRRFQIGGEDAALEVIARYDGHARRRLAERNISEAEVEAVISNPSIELPPKRKGRIDVMGRVNGRLIRVVYRVLENGDPHVITAYAPEEPK